MLAQRAAKREEMKAIRAQQIAQVYHQFQAQMNLELGLDVTDTNVFASSIQTDINNQDLESKENQKNDEKNNESEIKEGESENGDTVTVAGITLSLPPPLPPFDPL